MVCFVVSVFLFLVVVVGLMYCARYRIKKHRATVDRNALGYDLSIEESKQFRPKELTVATFNFDETRILGRWVWCSVRGDAKRS